MKISKFTYNGPDSDGDISFDMEAEIENETEYVIELVKTSCLMTNSDGVCVGGSYENESDAYIEPRDTGSIDLGIGYMKAAPFGGQLDATKAVVDAVFFRRDFHKMGEVEIPESHEKCTFLEKVVNVGGSIDIMGATCIRHEADDDGDVTVELQVGVRNLSDAYIDRVTTKIILLDQEDSQIEDSEDYSSMPPHSGRIFTPSVYTKKGRLRNSTIRLSVSLYLPVGHQAEEAVAVKE